jgi:hypothetical protein
LCVYLSIHPHPSNPSIPCHGTGTHNAPDGRPLCYSDSGAHGQPVNGTERETDGESIVCALCRAVRRAQCEPIGHPLELAVSRSVCGALAAALAAANQRAFGQAHGISISGAVWHAQREPQRFTHEQPLGGPQRGTD